MKFFSKPHFGCAIALALAACAAPTPSSPISGPTSAPTPAQNAAAPAPQATAAARPASAAAPAATAISNAFPANLAARVNGTPITKEQLDKEVGRYMAGDPDAPKPNTPAMDDLRQGVLDGMIEQALIEQEAARQRITISNKDLDAEITALSDMRGGQDQLKEWMQSIGITEPELRDMARQELTASAVSAKIAEQAPKTAEYVHAYHILVNTDAEAKQILTQLQGGAKFETLAKTKSVDSSTAPAGGDLDWFAQGTGAVIWEEVENAAFQLKPGQLSGVVPSSVGFHIIKVTARETRPLTAEDAAFLQQSAFENWLIAQKQAAKIERP